MVRRNKRGPPEGTGPGTGWGDGGCLDDKVNSELEMRVDRPLGPGLVRGVRGGGYGPYGGGMGKGKGRGDYRGRGRRW